MQVAEFDYHLPEELIAQTPCARRDASRLLVLDRQTGALEHRHFYDLGEYLRPGDVLVFNDTKVIPARLIGVKAQTGGKVEVFLLRRTCLLYTSCRSINLAATARFYAFWKSAAPRRIKAPRVWLRA